MPTYEISEGLANAHRAPAGLFEILFLDAVLGGNSATAATLQNQTATLAIAGTGLVYGGEGETNLLSGTLDSFTYTYSPGYYLTFTDLGLNIADLAAAAQAESLGDLAAMETLLYALDWTVIDNSTSAGVNDLLTSSDDIPIAFDGDNVVRLNYGHDTFWLGLGDDSAWGGWGDDVIQGGRGNDRIVGQLGADVLRGDEGNDKLLGGRGADLLEGGAGRDRLVGGIGDDVLTGGAGADRFVFVIPALYRDYDQITDFEAGTDRVVIRTDQATSLRDTAFGVVIEVGDFDILLKDVAEADLAPDSIAILSL
ncbi:MAG: hypothetical protein KDK24_16765 [Pseudooceanicola sp.]|nr:hypothetical protein [Pseudooceanicola sp.]